MRPSLTVTAGSVVVDVETLVRLPDVVYPMWNWVLDEFIGSDMGGSTERAWE